jgi:hypothetical protein
MNKFRMIHAHERSPVHLGTLNSTAPHRLKGYMLLARSSFEGQLLVSWSRVLKHALKHGSEKSSGCQFVHSKALSGVLSLLRIWPGVVQRTEGVQAQSRPTP